MRFIRCTLLSASLLTPTISCQSTTSPGSLNSPATSSVTSNASAGWYKEGEAVGNWPVSVDPWGDLARMTATLEAERATQDTGKPSTRNSSPAPANLQPNQPMHLCLNPKIDSDPMSLGRDTYKSWHSLRWEQPRIITLGPFDMTVVDCIPKQYDLYVENRQDIKIQLRNAKGASCTGSVTYVDNPPRDYGAVLANLVSPVLAKGALLAGKGILPPARPDAGVQTVELPHDNIKNTVATVTLSCETDNTEAMKDVPLGVQRKIILHYGDVDLVSASAGTIISTFGKRVFGIVNTTVGQNPDGTDKTVSSVGITSSSRVQFVPIALANFNFVGNRKINFNLQVGLGINPNGSSTQVEYFVGPSLALHNLYISPGLHIARSERLAGGFDIGDTVSSPSFNVPNTWKATYKFGVTLSYKPLSVGK